MSPEATSYAGRGGEKLASALDAFEISVEGLVCADFGSATGGFCDCLLRRGARRVHAVDTCYGQLDWKLRTDPRVVVHERTNALHAEPAEMVDLATVDVGWTPQRLIIPAVRRW
ncbi:MAG: SAM-dependent methyltransferase, partial [Phycisphaerae bacterium]